MIAVVGASRASAAISSFFVGNSITNDANPFRMAQLSASIGQPMFYGRHVRPGWGVDPLYAFPDDPQVQTEPGVGKYTQALQSRRWDTLTVQVFKETVSQAVRGTTRFANYVHAAPVNADTRILVFQAYPVRPTADETFADKWNAPSDGSSGSWATAAYWDLLMPQLNPIPNRVRFEIVPVGEAFYELSRRLETGGVPQITSMEELYRDEQHLNGIGRYLSAVTHLTVMNRRNLVDELATTSIYNLNGGIPSPELQRYMRQLAWDVVSRHPYVVIPGPQKLGGAMPATAVSDSTTLMVPEPAALGVLAAISLILTRRH